ncbi:PREDICTED: cytochrome P450 9e2-like [Habropoda laboriosa]|uniref:cytochrome P450 9e2-like n=1 Tax=Habropoda laboriosa TaxID=597456 RepID=UPI00083DB6E3|nr:PREDICTED: cytochrome P450 9e2-like [Habropoda laboriosa]
MDPLTLTLFLIFGLLLVYHFVWKSMTHFQQLDLLHESPVPILGNMAPSLFRRISLFEHLQHLYSRFSQVKYFGFYNFATPVIVIRDTELITSIAVKNFDHFCDHRGFVDKELDPLIGKNLFALRGDHWREMRKLLSPVFTSSKMKTMFHLMDDCANSFTDYIAKDSKQGQVFNLKEIFGRYTNDVVATCSFGISVDSMKNPQNEFYTFAKETMNFMSNLSLKFIMGKNFPTLSKLLSIRLFSENARRYFQRVIADTVRARKEKGIYRPDMIQLMMEAKDKDGNALTIEEMTCEAFIFFLAGFDSVSTLICFLAHEIAANPDVQAKLRIEIEEVLRKTDGKPTYESIKEMSYMDAVINETLRLYSLAAFLDRVCVKEFELPPATSGAKPVKVKPGDVIWFPLFAIQRDPKYFFEPNKFDPDRFLNGEIPQSVHIPFGLGPRVCIGNRFALLKCKMVLFYLLWRCELEPCDKTQIPIKFSTQSFILFPQNGFWLNFRARYVQSNSE